MLNVCRQFGKERRDLTGEHSRSPSWKEGSGRGLEAEILTRFVADNDFVNPGFEADFVILQRLAVHPNTQRGLRKLQ
jgi:hypothetical protein